MRNLVLTLIVSGFALTATTAMAADEFGERFSSETSPALTDPLQPDPALSLQNIEPAAGYETLDSEAADPEATLEDAIESFEEPETKQDPAKDEAPEVEL